MDLIPAEDVTYAWDSIIRPYFEEHFHPEDYQEVHNFLNYVESAYIGKPSESGRKRPLFDIPSWNVFRRFEDNIPATTNGIESWNARWNSTVGKTKNILRIISGFKSEDAHARTKYQVVNVKIAINFYRICFWGNASKISSRNKVIVNFDI